MSPEIGLEQFNQQLASHADGRRSHRAPPLGEELHAIKAREKEGGMVFPRD